MEISELNRVYKEIMPPAPRKRRKPVKPEDIIDDDESYSKIVGNVVNIVPKKKSDDFKLFAVDLKNQFKDPKYSIVYYDDETRRLQFEFPTEERGGMKENIRTKLSDYDLLIWDESIFNFERTMNDPCFKDPDKSWHFDEIGIEKAWDITTGESSVVIAVIDDGFDLNHVELKGKVYKPYNVINDNTTISCSNKLTHGTHVAGLAIANGNNGVGITGIAPRCRLMPIQAGSEMGFTSTDIIDGILYAIKNEADVINMSLGKSFKAIGGYNPEDLKNLVPKFGKDEALFWEEIYKMADDNNVTMVLAGGNDNVIIGLDPLTRSDRVIRVMAIGKNEKKSNFSNYFYEIPDNGSGVSAPGESIFSCVPANEYAFMKGTSMACPIVSGCIGLIKSIKPDITNKEIMKLLKKTSKKMGDKCEAPLIQIDEILEKLTK
jgi:subtilisin family serine protease